MEDLVTKASKKKYALEIPPDLKTHLELGESGLDPVLFVLGKIQDCELIPSLHLGLSL